MIGRRIQDENAYFRREYCIQELMWAKNAGKFIQPICRQKDKDRVGEFLELLDTPLNIGGVDTDISHFLSLGQVSWIDFNRTDKEYFDVGIKKLLREFQKSSIAPNNFLSP